MNLVEKYLIERGLFEPIMGLKAEGPNPIMDSDELLARAGGMFDTYSDVLALILKEKIKAIVEALVIEAPPAEVMVLRQAMLEVASIYDEAEKYSIEYQKRKKEKEGEPAGPLTAAGEAPKLEDNVQEPGTTGGL